MKSYFPFTDYDFYAYLTSGAFFLSVIDFVFNDAAFLMRTDWTFVQILMAVATAYVAGHIAATFAQLVIETFIVSKVISKPIAIQLGFRNPNIVERLIGVLVGRYYEPLEEAVQTKIKESARTALSMPDNQEFSAEDVFQVGFRKSFSVDGVRARMDSFLNQYGFCRNISFVALVATVIICWKAYWSQIPHEELVIISCVVVFVGMFIRFVKFYASFQAEVVRCLLK